ncbi:MAG: ATP-dependent helicase [Gammaproteobacteria bacterium]|nr:MAG: ATP-dependent helicase [Gammaproteobacteria bacterium]
MHNQGKPAKSTKPASGKVLIGGLSEFKPNPYESTKFAGDAISPAVRRLINSVHKDGKNVVLLARRNTVPWFVSFQSTGRNRDLDRFKESICKDLPREIADKASISTIHKYKGLEKDVVIILDAIQRSYPLIHPDWIFTRVLGDHPEKIVDEERRLFYVALTRAVDTLIVITEKGSESLFLNEMTQPTLRKFTAHFGVDPKC